MLHSSEVESQILEPLTNMFNNFQHAIKKIEMAKPSHLQTKKMRKYVFDQKVQEVMCEQYIPFDHAHTEPCRLSDIFMETGVTSNLPIMSGAVLKATQADGSMHLRPLCTTGDLLLALNQLMDPGVFPSGCVQLPDPHRELLEVGKGPTPTGITVGGIFGNSQTTFRPVERTFYRLDYAYRRHTRWFKFV
jgi:hypothetical protein